MRFQYKRIITAVTCYTEALYSKSVIYILIINRNVFKPFTILIKSYPHMNAANSFGDIKCDGNPIRVVLCGTSSARFSIGHADNPCKTRLVSDAFLMSTAY